jgi:hypothetical protein
MGKVAHMSRAARRSLEEPQASILFAPDFPRRINYTHAEYLELLKARSTKMHAPGIEAIKHARDQVSHLRSLVDLLGQERYSRVFRSSRDYGKSALSSLYGSR